MTPAEARSSFPGLADKVFLDTAAVSLAPRQAVDAVHAFLDVAMHCPARDASTHHLALDALWTSAAEQAARLLRTDRRHIALVESTTHGLNIAANAIPFRRGDNVLVADTEYLQVAIPWAMKHRTRGISIRPVLSRDEGVLTVEQFEQAIDRRTRAVCVSSVQWSSGYRVDVARLGALCRARGVWLVVDAVQQMGALALDLSESWADFVVAGGHKWLNAPFGCGVMYVGDRALEELSPAAYGYLAMEEPEGGWPVYFETPTTTPYREYRFPRAGKRFENAGTSNYPGAAGLAASLALVNAVGIDRAEAHIASLTALLQSRLRALGTHVVSKAGDDVRSGITVFSVFRDPRQDKAVVERLLSERILVSMRYTSSVGGIRVSTHYFNDEEDVDRLVAAVARAMRTR